MPQHALDNGSKLIIINNQKTKYDEQKVEGNLVVTVRFFENAGETLSKILDEITSRLR